MISLRAIGAFAALIAATACASAKGNGEIEVVAHDYAFQAPDTLSAGPTVIRYRNAGKMNHEMAMVLLKPGATASQYMAAATAGGNTDAFEEPGVGVLFARPGTTQNIRLAVDLMPGRHYLFICNFRDGADKPRHTMLGMIKELTVRQFQGSVPIIAAHEVTVSATEYAYSLPDTLPAGPTRLMLRNDGKVPHEIGIGLLAAGVTPGHAFAVALMDIDNDSLYEPGGAVLTAPPGAQSGFAIFLQLLPGRSYALQCDFQDSPDKPKHFKMGMLRGVEVR